MGMLAIFDTRRECPECKGCCMVPGYALVPVYGDGILVTRGYIWTLFHEAYAFREGWKAGVKATGDVYARKCPDYAEVRDFLHGLYDVDDVSAAQVALYYHPFAQVRFTPRVREFKPIV